MSAFPPFSPAPSPRPLAGRRDFLRVGSLTFAGSALPALGIEPAIPKGKADAVIFLWMAGGVTHIDSFDPKPEAPTEVRGKLGTIPTSLTGERFCETLPELAKIAHELAVVRSYSHDSNDHLLSQVYTLSGRKVGRNDLHTHPNIGGIVAHLRGPGGEGLPGYIAVPGITRPGPPPYNFFGGGWLGPHHAPFCVGGIPEQPDFTVGDKLENPPALVEEDLRPKSLTPRAEVPLARLDGRLSLRENFDRALGQLDRQPALVAQDGEFNKAVSLLTSEKVRHAFELDRESAALRDAYGRTKIGGRCLLARRLVEAGARFVMVDYGYDPDYGNVWDNHNAAGQVHPPIQDIVRRGYHLAGMDRAFAALVTDLRARGMLERTLVVFLTEFGRTPLINKNGGRDHWGTAGSLFFTGGGVKTGQIVGATDKTGAEVTTRPYSPADVAATLYTQLGIEPNTLVTDFQNRPRPILAEGQAIREIV
ncbi:MAG: DUF1501 domain-containing protein [Verrucomicrobiae bacterium]|nr:DUF1501 domain-containing protein [Verrucomicrobiae bacterium]